MVSIMRLLLLVDKALLISFNVLAFELNCPKHLIHLYNESSVVISLVFSLISALAVAGTSSPSLLSSEQYEQIK